MELLSFDIFGTQFFHPLVQIEDLAQAEDAIMLDKDGFVQQIIVRTHTFGNLNSSHSSHDYSKPPLH